MNIEIANRLVNLRKQNSLSQEALAEKLGISRQAVSKWERAEASPDTDNLILLSRIYGISMDELLRTEDEIPMPENAEMPEIEEAVPAPAGDGGSFSGDAAETAADGRWNTPEYVHIGLDGIHCKDKDSEVHVGWKGIHVVDTEDEVHVDSNGVYVNGEKYDGRYLWELARPEFPFAVLVIAAFYRYWRPYRGVASGLGNPPYDSSVAYLSGSFPEKGYDEVCLSFADLPYFSAPWHLQGAVASGMAGISGNTGVLCCCGLFQKIEERKDERR